MSGFSSMKRSRGDFKNLSEKLKDDKKGFKKDERYWELTVDDAKNGFAVIRFLPAPDGEEMPFTTIYSHSFKNEKSGKWYIENSRTTIGEADPVSEANSELWESGLESDKEIVRKRKRRKQYISNILVVSDSKNPQNEGKVFLFKYGPRLFQKIESAMTPEFEDETPFNPFDLWEGANFRLKARQLDGQRSYDKSDFDKPEALFGGDDDALEKLWKSEHSLVAEVAPDKFKSYDQLKTRFEAVVGIKSTSSQRAEDHADEEREVERSFSDTRKPGQRQQAATRSEPEGDDDGLGDYRSLLNDIED